MRSGLCVHGKARAIQYNAISNANATAAAMELLPAFPSLVRLTLVAVNFGSYLPHGNQLKSVADVLAILSRPALLV